MSKKIIHIKEEITNSDASKNILNIYSKEGLVNSPIILICPAMGIKASYYSPLAEALAQKGLLATSLDLRGNGLSSLRPQKGDNFGYHEMIEQDYKTAIHFLKDKFPAQKIYLLGHSLGGQIACLYGAKYPNDVQGLFLVACCSVFYRGWKGWGGLKILMGTQFMNLIAQTQGYLPGKKIGFGGNEAKGVIQDWSYQAKHGRYKLANDAFDYEFALKNCDLPRVAISFKKDNLAPEKAVQHLLDKFSSKSDKEEHMLLVKTASGKYYNHFNWVKDSSAIVEAILHRV